MINGRLACRFDPDRLATPAFVVDLGLLEENCRILDGIRQRTGCKILLALKCFAMYAAFSPAQAVSGRYLRQFAP